MTLTPRWGWPGEHHRRADARAAQRTAPAAALPVSRLRPRDVLATGSVGLRTRRLRSALTALGIAIGIAALVAVLGISASSKADLLAELDALGTNRLQVQAGQSFLGEEATLPPDATAMIRRIGPVTAASGLTGVDATVRRTDAIPDTETGGISVQASDTDLLDTVGGSVRTGRFLDAATSRLPAVVLGSTAAERLGIRDLTGSPAVYLGGQWFTVIGILDPVPVLANLDSAAFIGYDVAEQLFATSRSPSTVHVRTDPEPRSTPSRPCWRPRPTRPPRRRSRCLDPPTPSPPGRRSTTRSPPCCSAWAASPCSSAASGSPT